MTDPSRTSPERHTRTKEIFIGALELDPSQRAQYVAEACAGDDELRREVESLLAHASDDSLSLEDEPGEPEARFHAGEIFADRYRIVSVLGRGAMGEVYRADDLTLQVTVALKLLLRTSAERMGLLLNEVRQARKVTHPAVCRVFDVGTFQGEHFFTMEYVAGEDLRNLLRRIGKLPVEKVREIGIQLAEGLAAAHDEGVLHRDLKPANIVLDEQGNVKITDFGVATSSAVGSRPGLVGTPAYMAPEQLRGQPASVQSDLYALGLVLYEAATGTGAHEGESITELIADRSADRVVPPSQLVSTIDPTFDQLIIDMLQSDPAKRPSSANEIVQRLAASRAQAPLPARRPLRSVARIGLTAVTIGIVAITFASIMRTAGAPRRGGPAVTDADRRLSIAVLPFENVGGDPANAAFVEGVHAEVIAELSKIRSLRVISRSTVRTQSIDGMALPRIAERLGAAKVAEGWVRRAGDRVRVIVSLIDPENDEQVWTETYERELTPDNVFDIESDVAMKIATALGAELTDSEKHRIEDDPKIDLDAYDFYQKGRYAWRRYTEQGFTASVDAFKQALDRDPGFAPAWAGLGTVYAVGTANGWMPAERGYPEARRAADEALRLDAELAEAYVVLGLVNTEYQWDWAAAERSFRRAIELNPSSAWAQRAYAKFLSCQRRFEEARQAAAQAVELSPTSALMIEGLAWRAYEARAFDRASALAELTIRLDPRYADGYKIRAFAEIGRGRLDAAVRSMEEHVRLSGRTPLALASLAYAYGRAGRLDEARAVRGELTSLTSSRFVDPGQLALAAVAVGANEDAIEKLGEAIARRSDPSIWLAVDPKLDPLRDDPRYQELIRRVGLPTS